jgi:hypothetical protein
MIVMRLMIALGLFVPAICAGGIFDYIRNYDLNNYALGLGYSLGQSPYVGGENSGFAYPYLTSFRHNAFTDDWLIVTGGEAGFRWTNKKGWVLGAVARVNTQGTSTTVIEDLIGLDTRKWAVEVAPLVGWRAWPVHLEFRHFKEIFSDYGGPTSELRFSLPREFGWGWIVPSVDIIHNSADRNRYYYGVSESELIPEISPYEPGSSTNARLGVHFGYAITEKWLLSGSVSHEWLGSEISDSPIVARDGLWSGSVGIAYNNDIFRGLDYEGESFKLPGFELRAGLYKNNTDSKILRLPVSGGPAEEVDLEDALGINRKDNVLHIEGIVRFAHFHRLQVGYFELGRESNTTLLTDITIGDETFLAGTEIDVDSTLEIFRVAYGFSLMNDAQKELGVLVGIHTARVDSRVESVQTGQVVESSLDTPLPVVGLFGSLALGENTDLQASVEIFRMEFDHYDGSLNALYLGVNHYFMNKFGAGIGYNYYAMNLDSPDQSLRGSLRIRHHGPIVFASFTF